MTDPVGNKEDRFSHAATHLVIVFKSTFLLVMLVWSHHFFGVFQYYECFKCLAQGHYKVEVGGKPSLFVCLN